MKLRTDPIYTTVLYTNRKVSDIQYVQYSTSHSEWDKQVMRIKVKSGISESKKVIHTKLSQVLTNQAFLLLRGISKN